MAATLESGKKPRRRSLRPSRIDPSRTGALMRRFERALEIRFNRFKKLVRELIVEEDIFGLKPENREGLPLSRLANQEGFSVFNQSEFGAVMLRVRDREVSRVTKRIQSALDSNDVLELETDPHITVRYGIHDISRKRVELILRQYRLVTVKLIGLSLFENPTADVLKFSVSSRNLSEIHKHLGILPNTETHADYKPHLTIAYLKPGTGKKYLGFVTGVEGRELGLREFIYSSPERKQSKIVVNTAWRFRSSEEQLRLFERWIAVNLGYTVLPPEDRDAYWQIYIDEAYKKGTGRAFDDLHKQARIPGKNLDFYKGTKAQFLASSFGSPASVEKVKLLSGRTYTDLVGVTEAMATAMKRSLVDGMIQGKNPNEIAREISANIDGIGINRAKIIARTEIMRAHAEGQLDAFEKMGVERLGVMAEWSTAKDDRVCPLCAPLEGIVVKMKEARGMLPRHPRCRCVWLPSGVGEESKDQKKTPASIRKAIDESVTKEIPKREIGKRSLKEQRKLSRWSGATKSISRERPKSVLEKTPVKPPPKPPKKPPKPLPPVKPIDKTPKPPKPVAKPVEKAPKKPKPEKVDVPAPVNISLSKPQTDFTRKAWEFINKKGGMLSKEKDYIKLGDMVRKQVLNHKDLKAWEVGRKKINARLSKAGNKLSEARSKFNASTGVGRAKAESVLTKVKKEYDEVLQEYSDFIETKLDIISRAAREVLGEVRDFGGADPKAFLKDINAIVGAGRKEIIDESVAYALERLPDSWVDDIKRHMIKVKKSFSPQFDVVDRGYYIQGYSGFEVKISDGSGNVYGALSQPDLNSTMLHELVHAAEDASNYYKKGLVQLPGGGTTGKAQSIGHMEKEFLERRIKESPAPYNVKTEIYHNPDKPELGWKDRFISHYMGKDYGTTTFHEIMTMGVEHAFRSKSGNKASYMHSLWNESKEENTEYLNFILGMLAGY